MDKYMLAMARGAPSSLVWAWVLPTACWEPEQELRNTGCRCGLVAVVLSEQCRHFDRGRGKRGTS